MNTDFRTLNILSRREAAAYLGICRTTLDSLDIPRTKIGRRVMFKREVLNKWIDAHTEKGKGAKA
jgi:excisionase family DNA binding protein